MSFKGTFTALITPFEKNGDIDFDNLKKLVERQILAGIDGVVPVGTTGESPTLNTSEHLKVIQEVVKIVNKRCQVIAGTGANSTAEAVELTLAAKSFGVDGTLQVTPYYNKPNDEGLIRHFSKIADIGVPVVLYNVPGRTSKEISLDVIKELSKHKNIVSIKEASGTVENVKKIKDNCTLEVLSGDDILAVPMIKEGAQGVISVASNAIPKSLIKMINKALEGDFIESEKIHNFYKKFFDDLFIDTNPIPIKSALSFMQLAKEIFRLPLCSMPYEKKEILFQTMKKTGVLDG